MARNPVLRVLVLALGAAGVGSCAETQTVCPEGTDVTRRIFSGGGEVEWCRREDGVRQGGEGRYYENGATMIEGSYLDGAREGLWRYYAQGRRAPWREDRWEDGAMVDQRLDARATEMGAGADLMEPTSSGVIKLVSADPRLGRLARAADLPPFAVWYDNGRPRVLGHYDADGLRSGTWRYWFEAGGLTREVDYDAGVRHRLFREWHANGRPKTDGFYLDGERSGRWRRWNEVGQVVDDHDYTHVMLPP
jgi:antitoxin component YwqK of YwqJK toxin-antitoxin module